LPESRRRGIAGSRLELPQGFANIIETASIRKAARSGVRIIVPNLPDQVLDELFTVGVMLGAVRDLQKVSQKPFRKVSFFVIKKDGLS
jgi:hypothetical protein